MNLFFHIHIYRIINYSILRWVFEKIGCYISGSLMYFIGCTSIYLLVVLSVERYKVYYRNMPRVEGSILHPGEKNSLNVRLFIKKSSWDLK